MENNDLIKLYEIRALMSRSLELARDVENEKKSIMVNTDYKNKEISSKTKEIEELKKKCNEKIIITSEDEYVKKEMQKRQKDKYSYPMEHTREYYESQINYKPTEPICDFSFGNFWDMIIERIKVFCIVALVIGIIISFVIDSVDSFHNFFLVKWLYEWKDNSIKVNGWTYVLYYALTISLGFILVFLVTLIGYTLYCLVPYLFSKNNYNSTLKRYNNEVDSKVESARKKLMLEHQKIDEKNKIIEKSNNNLLVKIKEEYKEYVNEQKSLIKKQEDNKKLLFNYMNSYGVIKKKIDDDFKIKNNKHEEAIQIKKFEMDNVLNELDNCCEEYINYNDLEDIDTLIYYISTYRASNLKEALNLLDKDKRLNLTLDALDKMRSDINEQIEYAITTSMKYVDNAMKHINSSLGQVNYNLDAISNNVNENNRLASSLLDLQYRLNDKMNVIINKQERTDALVYNNMALVSSLQNQVSVSSQEMMKKMKSIRSDIFWK